MLSRSLLRGQLRSLDRIGGLPPRGALQPSQWVCIVRTFANKIRPPRTELNDYYLKEQGEQVINENSFQFEDHLHEGRVWWTARFVCPLTREIYNAGTLREDQMFDQWTWSKGSRRRPIEVGGKLFYPRLKTAINAAAARKLDAINCKGDDDLQIRFCQEDPSLEPEVLLDDASGQSVIPPSSPVPVGVTFESDQGHGQSADALLPPDSKGTSDVILPDLEDARQSPKHAIHVYYDKMRVPFSNDAFESSLVRGDGISWWSTSFLCPFTGVTYTSGTLIDEETFGTVKYAEKGKPLYKRLKSANQAAAARAIDDIMYRLTGATSPRLCHEDPSTPDNLFVLPEADDRLLKTEKVKASKDSISVTMLDDQDAKPEEEEEYSLMSVTPQLSNTLERIIGAWSGSSLDATISKSDEMTTPLIPLLCTPSEEREKILDDAKAWWDSLHPDDNRTADLTPYVRFQNTLQVSMLNSCNSLLSALARANQIENRSDVQALADKILNYLWAGPKPNTDTFGAYMQCLHGQPLDVAQRAHSILEDMLVGKVVLGRTFPSPSANLETFNTVMKLWAWAGEAEKCQAVFEDMQRAGIKPNRETFHTMLFSLARGKFDRRRASSWLETMKNMDLLDPGAYTAPLRWGGKQFDAWIIPWDSSIYREPSLGNNENGTTFEAKEIEERVERIEQSPEIAYSNNAHEAVVQAYHDGSLETRQMDLAEAQEFDISEAEEIERWVMEIEQSPELVVSNGCYEAVIQAWARTGTRSGLQRAESWALRAFASASSEDHLEPRLQTFFPVVAAMAYSRSDRENLNIWIDRLDQWKSRYPQLCPDSRIRPLSLLALKFRQESLSREGDLDQSRACALEATAELKRLSDGLKSYHSFGTIQPRFLEAVTFSDTIACWVGYVRESLKQNCKHSMKSGVDSLLGIAAEYHMLVAELRQLLQKREPNLNDDENGETEEHPESGLLRQQYHHLLGHASDIYHRILPLLGEVHQALHQPDSDEKSLTFLPEIESILRTLSEYSCLQNANGDFRNIVYSDGFQFIVKKDCCEASRLMVFERAVEQIIRVEHQTQSSEKARLLVLIREMMLDYEDQLPYDKKRFSAMHNDMVEFLGQMEMLEKEGILRHFLHVAKRKPNASSSGKTNLRPFKRMLNQDNRKLRSKSKEVTRETETFQAKAGRTKLKKKKKSPRRSNRAMTN